MFQPTTKEGKKAAQHLDNASSDFKSGTSELKSAKNSAKSAIRGEFDNATDQASEKVRDLRATARQAGEKVQNFLHERRDDVQHARETTERTVRANPLASLAAAFVGGAVISRLLKR